MSILDDNNHKSTMVKCDKIHQITILNCAFNNHGYISLGDFSNSHLLNIDTLSSKDSKDLNDFLEN